MKKTIRILSFLFLITLLFTGTAKAYEATSKNVKFSNNGEASKIIKTFAYTVEEFFEEQGIDIGSVDVITPDLGCDISSDLIITYNAYNEVTLIIDGKNTTVATKDQSVKSVIEDYSKVTGLDYAYDKSLASFTVTNGTIIEITTNTKETVETKEEISFETETISNPDLEEGVKNVITAGVVGEKTVRTEINYVSGKEKSRKVTYDAITLLPVKEVVEIGTAQTVVGIDGTYKFKKEIQMSASAYTANYECTGKSPGNPGFGITASGRQAQVGVVAVDPKIIPLGTELYIDGYGFAIAGDTGGAIKGNKIDLYFDSYSQCISFGRQTVKVYVL